MTTTTANPQPCQARTKKGRQCSAYAVAGSVYCFAHDPALRETRTAARRSGGQARHGRKVSGGQTGPVKIETVKDVLGLLGDTVNDVLLLENSLNRANVISRLALAMVKCFEVSELEQRLLILEGKVLNSEQS